MELFLGAETTSMETMEILLRLLKNIYTIRIFACLQYYRNMHSSCQKIKVIRRYILYHCDYMCFDKFLQKKIPNVIE